MTDNDIMDQVINPMLGCAMYFDRARHPISLRRWSALFEDVRYKIIARDRVLGARVVTIWDGFDSTFSAGLGLPPDVFGTMVFGGPDEFEDHEWRWPTESMARRGHWIVRKHVRRSLHCRNGPAPLTINRGKKLSC
jgi:hypothetical protein